MENALEIVTDFGKYSGLKLNVNKSQALLVNSTSPIFEKGQQLTWRDSVSILGIKFHNVAVGDERIYEEFDNYVGKMSDICQKWSNILCGTKQLVSRVCC